MLREQASYLALFIGPSYLIGLPNLAIHPVSYTASFHYNRVNTVNLKSVQVQQLGMVWRVRWKKGKKKQKKHSLLE